jgi:hypothetical protein
MSRFAVFLLAMLLACTAAAAGFVAIEQRLTPAQMHETGLDTLTPDQLAALNRLLRSDDETRPTAATPSQVADDPGRHVGMSDQPIHSRVKGDVAGWAPGTVFELENGQQWKVLKGELTLRKPMHAPEVVVAPGLVGRWFLQVSEDYPKARVYRVD